MCHEPMPNYSYRHCWLCVYQNDKYAKQLNEFIVKNIGYIDIQNMSAQIEQHLTANVPNHTGYDRVTVEVRQPCVLGCADGSLTRSTSRRTCCIQRFASPSC